MKRSRFNEEQIIAILKEREAGMATADALRKHGCWTLEIVRRCDAAKGFVLLPRRWVVERTFAWTTIAHIRRLTRLIANHCQIR